MNSVLIAPPVPRQRWGISCIASFLLLLSPATLADGISDADRQRATGETGAGGSLRTVGAYPYAIRGFTVTPMAGGKVLVYGNDPLGLHVEQEKKLRLLQNRRGQSLSGAFYSDPLIWTPERHGWEKIPRPPECPYYRFLHTATAIANSKVLIAGGLCDGPRNIDNTSPYVSHTKLSLWDGVNQKWEPVPSLHVGRIHHSASLLSDGSVMLVGGETDPAVSAPDKSVLESILKSVLNSVEVFRNGAVAELAPLQVARAHHTATPLANGKLLVAGGIDKDRKPIASVEIWEPGKQRWQSGPPLKQPRYGHSATLLSDGRVMVAGGINLAGGVDQNGGPIGAVEIWDPAYNTWSTGASLLLPLQGHSATLLSNGDVLVMGGSTIQAEPVAMAMVWDKTRAQWRAAGFRASNQGHIGDPHSVTLVPRPDGTAHVFGFRETAQWSPTTNTVSATSLYGARENHSVTLLRDGRLLLAGGRNGNAFLDWAEIYNPVSGRFSSTERLHQARHSHDAVILNDGRVLVAGGWVRAADKPNQPAANSPEVWDPATGRWNILKSIRFEWQDWVQMGKLADGRIMFFASRELAEDAPQGPVEYRAWVWNPRTGHVESKQPRLTPHSKAIVSILPDGRVIRAGGNIRRFVREQRCPPTSPAAKTEEAEHANHCQNIAAHWAENPDASGEVWHSVTGTVSTLTLPPNWDMGEGKSLILKDGNVLFLEHRPLNIVRNRYPAPARMFLWNSRTDTWKKIPALTTAENWPMLELHDGSLWTATHYLPPNAPAWLAAPSLRQENPKFFQLTSGQLLGLSVTPPHAARLDTATLQWQVQLPSDVPPAWRTTPATTALADGRVMVIAQVEKSNEALPTAYLWSPRENLWTSAGKLTRNGGSRTQAIQLPSGRVLHIGIGDTGNDTNKLICEIWQPGDNSWELCSDSNISGAFETTPGLGLLEDGRAVVVASPTDVFVFNEKNKRWTPMKAEWNTEQLTYGAPIRADKPLQRIFDEEKKKWHDISGVAGKYWEQVGPPHRGYDVLFSDRPKKEYKPRTRSPYLLWDYRKKLWAYVFVNEKMGRHAQFLPDGCAFSWTGFSLFNPSTGKVTELTDPGTGIKNRDGSMVVLADGTVVIAGLPATTADTGFFHRKVSCDGFEPLPEDTALMPGVMAKSDPSTVTPGTPPVLAASWWAQLKGWAWEARWIALALVIPLLTYVLLRTVILPLLRKTSLRIASRVLPKNKIELFQKDLPRPFAWASRAVLYGLLVVVAGPMLLYYVQFKRITDAQACAESPELCRDKKTGALQSVAALEKTETGASAKPAIPCRYVGVWSSRQGQNMHRITLKDDGTYAMDANEYRGGHGYTGFWMVQNNHMVWRHKGGDTGEPDINPILPESDTRFKLVEMNGKHTQYELIRAIESKRCTP